MAANEQDDEFLFYSLSMIGSESGRERYRQLAELNKQRREQREREASLRKSRESDVQRYEDEAGTAWEYVVIDGSEVHLTRCETCEEELRVPARIVGLPVTHMREGSCARLSSVKKVIIPPSVRDVDERAFQFNESLQGVTFSDSMERFSSRMFQGCNGIRTLRLPGELKEIGPDVLSLPSLESLFIGSGTESIVPGAFSKSRLKSIEIDDGNPYLATDGIGIYDRFFTELFAIACPVASYEVASTCTVIGPMAFSRMECIEKIVLAESTETIEDKGLANTGITSFDAPCDLWEIGQRAFLNCKHLNEVNLNQGLRQIGLEAFKGTNVRRIEIPDSVRDIETPLLDAVASAVGEQIHSMGVSPDSPYYLLDDAGGLYRKTPGGLVFQYLLDDTATSYAVIEGTVEIGSDGFSQRELIQVVLPDSVKRIGDGSFKGCKNLATVNMPVRLDEIGENAFLDTSITSLFIPASLTRIGDCALISAGAHNGRIDPSLTEVIVEEGNPRFFIRNGLLLEKKNNATLKVVLYVGPDSDVHIPPDVSEIAPYAFNGVTKIRELSLMDGIKTVGTRGLAIKENLRRLRIDLTSPLEGHDFFMFDLPQTDRCYQQINNALGFSEPIDLESLFDRYDVIILNAASLANDGEQGMALYEQSLHIIERLEDPIFMSVTSKKLMSSFIERHLEDICIALARHDDRDSFDALMDLGYLSREGISEIIGSLAALQDASITGYLLEAKRLKFGDEAVDFDI